MTDLPPVRITCLGADTMPLDELVGLQGNLKSLSKENYARMKHTILKHGFAAPIMVATIDGKPHGVIDGHQRHRVLTQMAAEGFEVPDELPVVFTECDNEQAAAELILAMVSQYGKVDDEGLSEFITRYDLNLDDLPLYDLPDFDLNEFLGSQAEEPGTQDEDEPTIYTCPECGHSFLSGESA